MAAFNTNRLTDGLRRFRGVQPGRLAGPAVVAAVSLAVFCGLLGSGNRLPYVSDNNESFSSLSHAMSLYRLGVDETCGLTDDVSNSERGAHPFVHTHQGNFPRLYAYILYFLGARSIESQIAATAFTVGLATMLLAYWYFSRIGKAWFAVLACLLLLTDYVMFSQWQVVTYRVWYTCFLFTSLHCMHGLGGERRGWWYPVTLTNFACIYYFEYVFALFVTLAAAAYAALLYWRTWRVIVRSAAVSAAGAVCGCGILLAQLIAYMGFDGVCYDAYLTINARNGSEEISGQAREFYNAHNILFWENYYGGESLRTLGAFATSFFTYTVGPYTPLLVLVVVIVLTGALAEFLEAASRRYPAWRAWLEGLARRAPSWWQELEASRWAGPVRLGTVWVGACLFFFSLLRDLRYAGFSSESDFSIFPEDATTTAVALFLALGFCLGAGKATTGRWWAWERMSWHRVGLAGLFLAFFGWFIRKQPKWSNQNLAPLWEDIAGAVDLWLIGRAICAIAAAVSVLLILGRLRSIGRRRFGDSAAILRFLGAGFIAYSAVYWISAGYVYTGYLHRWAPFLVFFANPLVAVCAYVLLKALWRETRTIGRWRRRRTVTAGGEVSSRALRLLGAVGPGGAIATLLVFMGSYWIHVQAYYFAVLPPDQFAVHDVLKDEPFRGKSFIVNTYALPTACATGSWAYYDPQFHKGGVELGPDGYVVEREAKTYRWFADRETNPEYEKPEYFLYQNYQDPFTVSARLAWEQALQNGEIETPPESPLDVCAAAICQRRGPLRHRVVSRDPSGRDRWMIIKLDWDYPAYLESTADGQRVVLSSTSTSDAILLNVFYNFIHQEGAPEADSIIRLYDVRGNGQTTLLKRQRGSTLFQLPPNFAGNVRASVIPCTGTKRGEEFFSKVYRIGDVPSLEPPYLQPLDSGDAPRFVKAHLRHIGAAAEIEVVYDYRHADGEPEQGTLVRLYVEREDGTLLPWREYYAVRSVEVSPELLAKIAETRGRLRVSVSPRSRAAAGEEYFCREPLSLGEFFRPYLTTIATGDEEDNDAGRHVQVSLEERADKAELTVNYAYGHAAGEEEEGTIVRVYYEEVDGSVRLAKEERDVRRITLERPAHRSVRVSVTPSDGRTSGPEYFSEMVELK